MKWIIRILFNKRSRNLIFNALRIEEIDSFNPKDIIEYKRLMKIFKT